MFLGVSLVTLLIWIVIICACVALAHIALGYFGVAIPPFVIQIFWIVTVAVVVIFAIKVVAGLL